MPMPYQAQAPSASTQRWLYVLALLPILLAVLLPASGAAPRPDPSSSIRWTAQPERRLMDAGDGNASGEQSTGFAAGADTESAAIIERFEALTLSELIDLPEADSRRFLDELANTYHVQAQAHRWLSLLERVEASHRLLRRLMASMPTSLGKELRARQARLIPYSASLIVERLWFGEEAFAGQLLETLRKSDPQHPDLLAVCGIMYSKPDQPSVDGMHCLQQLVELAPNYRGLGLDASKLGIRPRPGSAAATSPQAPSQQLIDSSRRLLSGAVRVAALLLSMRSAALWSAGLASR